MDRVSNTDIATLLDKWYEAKQVIAEKEAQCERYKRLANRAMKERDSTTIRSSDYTLVRRQMTKTTIFKKDVPKKIWDEYSRSSTFPAYYLSLSKKR